MNNDLISREALRKAFHERIYHFDKSSWDEVNAIIDNAPTVENADEKTVEELKSELERVENADEKTVEELKSELERVKKPEDWCENCAFAKFADDVAKKLEEL